MIKSVFPKNPPGFWTFETSSGVLTSNRFFPCISTYWDFNFVSEFLPVHRGMSFSHFAFIGWQVDLARTGSFLLGSLSESPQQRLHTLGHGLCQPPECPSKELLSGWLWQRRQINSLPSHFPSLALSRFFKKNKFCSSFKVAQLRATEILLDKWAKQKRTEVWYTLSKKCDSITNSALVFF